LKPDNAEVSFKCKRCGITFSKGSLTQKQCPSCSFNCTESSCKTLGSSNEGY